MGLELNYIEGQTPIDEEEMYGLRIPTITTRRDLDEFEQQNIEQAVQWIFTRSFKADAVFTEAFICNLHKRMYSDVWDWAGMFRKTNKNLGVDSWKIRIELKALLEDARFWISNQIYPPDEMAIRFKHRIVSIHCFSNGNGRHSRLIADIIIEKIYKMPVFTWGAENLSNDSNLRRDYIQAVKAADKGDYTPLLLFARS